MVDHVLGLIFSSPRVHFEAWGQVGRKKEDNLQPTKYGARTIMESSAIPSYFILPCISVLICAFCHCIYEHVWLITGCSSGLGGAINYAAFGRGDDMIVTTRKSIQRLRSLKEAGAVTLDTSMEALQAEHHCVIEGTLTI